MMSEEFKEFRDRIVSDTSEEKMESIEGDTTDAKTETASNMIANTTVIGVFYNPPFTAVKFANGTVATSECSDFDVFDPYVGFGMAIMNHYISDKKIIHGVVNTAWKQYGNKFSKQIRKNRESYIKKG